MSDTQHMTASPSRTALGIVVLLLVATPILLRLADEATMSLTAGNQPNETYCCGVYHPATDLQLVCVADPSTFLETATDRLGLPPDCAELSLPKGTPSGCRVALHQETGGCRVKTITELSGAYRFLAGARMNVNTANVEDLSLLPGIGEVKASAIVEYRSQHGAFQSLDDLESVYGIGPQTASRIAPYIEISAPPHRGTTETTEQLTP